MQQLETTVVVMPTYADLHENIQQAFKNDLLNTLLNQPPHRSWLKAHPIIKAKDNAGNTVPYMYLPVDKVEFMLTRIFQKWYVEVIKFEALFQSVAIHIRLHYYNPYSQPGEWRYSDGVGAAPIQTDKDKSAADLGAIKSGAVQMALPSAKSYAVKDAAEQLGTIFGRDLNRKDTVLFSGSFTESALQPAPAIERQLQKAIQPAVQEPAATLSFNASDL